jgi:hypothetical protein
VNVHQRDANEKAGGKTDFGRKPEFPGIEIWRQGLEFLRENEQ